MEEEGFEALPRGEALEDTVADGAGFGGAAVEEDGIDGGSIAEEVSEVAGDGGVARVRESHFAEARGVAEWRFTGTNEREEAVEEEGTDFGGADMGLEGRVEEGAAGEGDGDREGGVFVGGGR